MAKKSVAYADKKLASIMKLETVEEFKFSPVYSQVKKAIFDYNLSSDRATVIEDLNRIKQEDSRYSEAIQHLISHIKLAI